MSLFNNVSVRSGEDIATEVISYMLASRQEYIPFQKLFFNRILKKPLSSSQLQVETVTQATFEYGRPDLIILTNDTLIVVETKLGAYLSGDDQLIKYCNVFKDKMLRAFFPFIEFESITKNILIYLAPRSTVDLSIAVCNRLSKRENGRDFIKWCTQQHIDFIPLFWEEVLSDLDTKNSVQNELFLFVESYIYQELNEEEIMILKDENVPNALNKLFNTIYDIRNYLASKKIKIGRLGQSYNYYGFQIESETLSSWFGYFLPIWEKYKTPVFLQVREEWIKGEKGEVLKKLKKLGFSQEPEQEFILPFSIDSIGTWKEDLTKIISNL